MWDCVGLLKLWLILIFVPTSPFFVIKLIFVTKSPFFVIKLMDGKRKERGPMDGKMKKLVEEGVRTN